MLSLLIKRDLSEQNKKDIKDCFINMERNEVILNDGFKYVVNKAVNKIPVGNSDTQDVVYINISVYYNNSNVSNSVYDNIYYHNVLIPLIKEAFNFEVPHECCDEHCHCH